MSYNNYQCSINYCSTPYIVPVFIGLYTPVCVRRILPCIVPLSFVPGPLSMLYLRMRMSSHCYSVLFIATRPLSMSSMCVHTYLAIR